MSYGDDDKWGGCLEIYGDVLIQILDIKFGCFYLPVNHNEQKTTVKAIEDEHHQPWWLNRIEQRFRNTLAKKMRDRG